MSRFLVIYGTKYGQTRKIANYIANELVSLGHSVDLFDSKGIAADLDPGDYDALIIGAPVYANKFPRPLRAWVANHKKTINEIPSAFFSVCLGVLQKEEAVQKNERAIVERFLSLNRWQPKNWTIFAGSLAYSKYNVFLKWMMRRISLKGGMDTDTNRDYEFTNWNDVREFTRDFAKTAAAA